MTSIQLEVTQHGQKKQLKIKIIKDNRNKPLEDTDTELSLKDFKATKYYVLKSDKMENLSKDLKIIKKNSKKLHKVLKSNK